MNKTEHERKPMHPAAAGGTLFLFDSGLSIVVGFIIGFDARLFFGITEVNGLLFVIEVCIGLLISLYAAIILRRQYSTSVQALYGILAAGAVYGVLNWIVDAQGPQPNPIRTVLLVAASLLAYGIGWFLAAKLPEKFWTPGKRVVIIFAVLGVVNVLTGIFSILVHH